MPSETDAAASDLVRIETAGASLEVPFYAHPECTQHRPQGPATEVSMPWVGAPGPVQGVASERFDGRAPHVRTAWGDAPSAWPAEMVLVGTGVSYDREIAWRKAVVELLERFAALCPPRAALRRGRPSEMSPAVRSDPDGAPCWWFVGRDVATGQDVRVAYDSVQIRPRAAAVDTPTQATSTGCAVHVTADKALAAGLQEAVERRAVSGMLSGCGRGCVTPSVVSAMAQGLVDIAHGLGWSTDIVSSDMDSALVTAIVACSVEHHGQPRLVFGSAARQELSAAIDAASLEAHGMLMQALTLPFDPVGNADAMHGVAVDGAAAVALRERLRRPTQTPARGSRPQVVVLDRGNDLLDQLGLHAVQVVLNDDQRSVT